MNSKLNNLALAAFIVFCCFFVASSSSIRSSIYLGKEQKSQGHGVGEIEGAGCKDSKPRTCQKILNWFGESICKSNAVMERICAESCHFCEHKMPAEPVCVDQFEVECPKVKRFCENRKFSLSIQKICPKTCNTCHTESESGVHEGEGHTVAIL